MAKLFFYLGLLISSSLFTETIILKSKLNGKVAQKKVVKERIKDVTQTEYNQNK